MLTEFSHGLTGATLVYYGIGICAGLAHYLHMLLWPQRNNDFGMTPLDGVMNCVVMVSVWPLVVLAWFMDNGDWRG